MSDAHRLQLAFSGLHPERIRDLTNRFGGPAAAIAAITRRRVNASEAIRSNLAVPAVRREAELTSLGINVVRRGVPAYPAHLDQYEDAPDLLFVRGDLPTVPGVGIVGTRRCTAYGLELAEAYGVAVAEAGWPVVSGLARGIDGAAHRGMVAAGGRGVAVLGCGIDVTYPKEHRRLGDQILELGGAIVSEYPPGSRPDAWRFPPRNRRNLSQDPETRSARRQWRCAHLSASTEWLREPLQNAGHTLQHESAPTTEHDPTRG